ncbi:Uncharacterized protein dnm_045480 [Desulfonema magnum]|uniref:Uncharacterized protein n=1 Tax=Desulfonema magnum TaxID=45655 RepID=A0A975BNH3_9BACT|nr:Uncharacterized protein dnm_045480 [Desulfonema magnum]
MYVYVTVPSFRFQVSVKYLDKSFPAFLSESRFSRFSRFR